MSNGIDMDLNAADIAQQLELLVAENSKEYEYQPLSTPTEQRFLLLDPINNADDSLHGKIIHRDLSSFNQSDDGYIAASYVWGASAKPHKIILDDSTFLHIATNCFLMLQRVRSLANSQPLWIDAICINQASNSEKSLVIGQMANIYTLAAQVLVYVGESNAYTSDAQLPSTPDGRVAKEAHELLERAWSWVIQEVIKGGDRTIFICGSEQMPWKHLYPVIFFFWPPRVHPPCVQMATNACVFHKDGELRRLLPQLRYCDATDPRDKVFSLLGIAMDTESVPRLDYHMSKEEVYTKIAVWWVQHYRSLEVLGHADGLLDDTPSRTPPPTMASWVPDWSRRPTREILGVFERTAFRAGGAKAFTSFPTPPTPSSHPVLRARGLCIDTLDSLIPHCTTYSALIPLFRHHGGYGSASANEAALSHTLRMGYTREHEPSAADRDTVLTQYNLWKATHATHSWSPNESRHGPRVLDEEYLPCYDSRPEDVKYEGLFRVRRIGRVLAITQNGFFCFAPDQVGRGDEVWNLYGSSMPVALRRVGGRYTVLGQCYVAGVMYGEILGDERMEGRTKGELPKFDNVEVDVDIW